jgi:hypothetical protein
MFKKMSLVPVALALSAVSAPVFAATTTTAPDFSALTGAVDYSTVIAAILGVAAVAVGVHLAWRGAKFVLSAVRSM